MLSIGLVMIVRNESAVIRRCLESVRNVINYWVICDTGSTDNTCQIIQDALLGIPGTLINIPWVDFGYTRTEALKRARGKAHYHLLIDADMTLNVCGSFVDKLAADSYLLRSEGPMDYYVPRLASDRHEWRYVGVTHEYLHSDTARTQEKLPQLSVNHFCDGSSRAVKYQRDIELLKAGLEKEPNNERYVFYLAQSYRDTGNLAQAMEWYEKRVSLGGWGEEVWHSMYQIGRMRHMLGMAWPLVLDSYLAAYQFRPTRIEPLFHIAKYYRENQQYDLGYLFAHRAIHCPYPDDLLFIERTIYEYELPTEYAVCCYWVGKHAEAIRVNDMILACPATPENFRKTATKNRQFSLDTVGSGCS